MIRKIILAFIILFVLSWVAGAHFLKSKLLNFINNSETDNLKISYEDSSISGFPFDWKIKFTSPKITIIDQDISRELSSDSLTCAFTYGLREAKLDLGKTLYYLTEGLEFPENSKLESADDIKIDIDFFTTLYKADLVNGWKKLIKNIVFNSESIISLSDKGRELFNLSAVNVSIYQNKAEDQTDNIDINLIGDYKASFEGRKVSSAHIDLNTNYVINEANKENNLDFDRKLNITKARFEFDKSYCSLKGVINFSRSAPPRGKISAELVGYEDLADMLVPDDFIFSSYYFKKLIAKAASKEAGAMSGDKISFDIDFSSEGINFGQVNLLDLK